MRPSPALLLYAGIFLAGAGSLYVLQQACQPKPTKVEAGVDSTLAEQPAWRDTVRVRDSVLAHRDTVAAQLRHQRAREHARADSAESKADSLQQIANELSQGEPRIALEAQKRAAMQFQATIGALKTELGVADDQIAQADSTILLQRRALVLSDTRLDKVTKQLDQLRRETRNRGRWNVLGLHLPGIVRDVALVGVSVGVTYAVVHR